MIDNRMFYNRFNGFLKIHLTSYENFIICPNRFAGEPAKGVWTKS